MPSTGAGAFFDGFIARKMIASACLQMSPCCDAVQRRLGGGSELGGRQVIGVAGVAFQYGACFVTSLNMTRQYEYKYALRSNQVLVNPRYYSK